MNRQALCDGVMVGPYAMKDGMAMWAEVAPAPRRGWRPLPGRTSRWWYEEHSSSPDTTWAYDPGGSGGAFTYRRCIERANAAIDGFVSVPSDERTPD